MQRRQVHRLSQNRQHQLLAPPKPKARRGRSVICLLQSGPQMQMPQTAPCVQPNQRWGVGGGGVGLDSLLCKKTRKCLIRDRGRRGCLSGALILGKCTHSPAPALPFTSSGQKQTLLAAQRSSFPSALTQPFVGILESPAHLHVSRLLTQSGGNTAVK